MTQTVLSVRPGPTAGRDIGRAVSRACREVAGTAGTDGLIEDCAVVARQLVRCGFEHAGTVDLTIGVDHDAVMLRAATTGPGTSPAGEGHVGYVRSLDAVRRRASSWGYHGSNDGRTFWASIREPYLEAPTVSTE